MTLYPSFSSIIFANVHKHGVNKQYIGLALSQGVGLPGFGAQVHHRLVDLGGGGQGLGAGVNQGSYGLRT